MKKIAAFDLRESEEEWVNFLHSLHGNTKPPKSLRYKPLKRKNSEFNPREILFKFDKNMRKFFAFRRKFSFSEIEAMNKSGVEVGVRGEHLRILWIKKNSLVNKIIRLAREEYEEVRPTTLKGNRRF